MAKEKLNVRLIASAKEGRHGDGGGLYLIVDKNGNRRWVMRYSLHGRVREMGLGGIADTPLPAARERAAEIRAMAKRGEDPLEAKRAVLEAQRPALTFADAFRDHLKTIEPKLSNEKHKWQWRQTLEVYAASLHDIPVDRITTADVLKVIEPLWETKNETASRLRGRIETVLNVCRVKGHIPAEAPNPARWAGHLEIILAEKSAKRKGENHHNALPFTQIPEFVARLRQREAFAARALEFTILTAARTGEVLLANWTEIDFEARVWTVPAERMKMGKIHRVPLCERAIEILREMEELRLDDLIFPGTRANKGMSNMAMDGVLRRMDPDLVAMGVYKTPTMRRADRKPAAREDKITVHGFRSAFRDWAGDCTDFQREVVEAALAHTVGTDVERAYRRSDALAKRRELMQAWAAYCGSWKGEVAAPLDQDEAA